MKEKIKSSIKNRFPQRVLDFLNRTPDKPYQRISFSLSGEDLFLERYFKDVKNGFYVDIGAHHPFKFSNTYLFYKNGWNGINVEPNQERLELFKNFRPHDINVGVGIGTYEGIGDYFKFDQAAYNTLDQDLAEKRKTMYSGKIQINVITLENLLENYLPKNKNIDFLKIDVEGKDMEVLKSNNWKKFRPNLVMVEDNYIDFSNLYTNEMVYLMTDAGYTLYKILSNNLVFAPK